ncbi:DUF5997 family protein [Schumannella sp. 10F1B-5-1]|uniref:DUF5997 family protein n=1 Tax=Schumannella sp. 10F1B-5-1 TaxID=2590780 RepID=UPI0011303469|nr:DUF5997 family protein [Schumannella sp. 10F1B-5-1]TPW71090.1 hypothetical protein FJ658_11500 [Schumannella sp. 10F1B-5-1]
MKPATAAKKLGIHLPSAPAEFQETALTREQFQALQSDPPEWLAELRRTGPHPKQEVARKLGVSTSGLLRAGITEPLTTAEIRELLEDQPEWLRQERATHAQVVADTVARKAAAADAARR